MNTQKLANLLAAGIREVDILDIMGCSMEDYQAAVALPATQEQVQQAKDTRYQELHDVNDMWDQMERMGGQVVLETLMTNPDPNFSPGSSHAGQ